MNGSPSGELRLHRDAVPHRFATRELNHLADRFVDLQAVLPRRRFLDKVTDPVGHLGRSIAILDDLA